MKKILLVLYYYQPYKSGLSEYAKSVAEELAKKYEVEVFTTKYDKDLPKEELINNVKVKRYSTLFSLSKWVFSPALIFNTIIKQKKYDKIIIYMPFAEAGLTGLLIKKSKLISFYVCDIRLGFSPIARLIEWVLYKSMRIQLRRSSKIVPLSLDYFTNSKIFKKKFENKSYPLVPYIDLTNDQPIVKSFREEHKISSSTFLIGFMGRIVYEKGIDYLINAIPFMKKKGMKNFKVIIGGDYKNVRGGSVMNKLKTLIDQYPEEIIVTGFIPEEEKADYFRALNVFILPSIDPLEAFGIVQVEAMKYGVPVVASALPGVREVINKTKFGLLSTPKSSENIAEQIFKIYSKKVTLSSYKKRYKEEYSEQKWKKNLLNIIEK